MAEVPLPNPFRKDAPGPRPPGIEPKDWARLGVIAVVFFLAVGAMIVLHFSSKRRGPAEPPKKKDPVKEETREAPAPGQDLEEDARTALKEIKDGPDEIRRDDPRFLAWLYFLQKLDAAEAARRVDPKLAPAALLADPAAHRGKFVRLKGRLFQFDTKPLGVTTATGTRDVYLGYLSAHPSEATTWFYLPDFPVDADTGKPFQFHTTREQGYDLTTDWVEIEGMFLRVYEYEGLNASGGPGRTIRAPVVFAKVIRRVTPPKSGARRHTFTYLVVGIAVAVIGAVVFAGVLSRKRGRKSIRMAMFDLKREKGQVELPKPNPVLGDEVKPPPEAPK